MPTFCDFVVQVGGYVYSLDLNICETPDVKCKAFMVSSDRVRTTDMIDDQRNNSQKLHLKAIIGDKLLLLYATVRQSSRNEIHRKAHTEVINNQSRS